MIEYLKYYGGETEQSLAQILVQLKLIDFLTLNYDGGNPSILPLFSVYIHPAVTQVQIIGHS